MPEFVMDELTRETCTFVSPTVLNLTGAVALHTRFRDMKRRDGSPAQSGDTTSVAAVQLPAGRALVKATLTLGAQDQLTLDTGEIYKSTAGAGLPGFSSAGAPGEVYVAAPVQFFQTFDDQGNLLRPDLFRRSAFPAKVVADFLAELGTVDREAVAALGVGASFDALAGLFAMDLASSETADGEDVFVNDHSATGRVKRVPFKPWPTRRGDNIVLGGALTLFAAATPGRVWRVLAWDATRTHVASALVIGDAAAPVLIKQFEVGLIAFELAGTSINIRNNTGGAITLSHIKPVIG